MGDEQYLDRRAVERAARGSGNAQELLRALASGRVPGTEHLTDDELPPLPHNIVVDAESEAFFRRLLAGGLFRVETRGHPWVPEAERVVVPQALRGWKAASVLVALDDVDDVQFGPLMRSGRRYRARDVAACHRHPEHRAPHEGCYCGFYAYRDRERVRDVWQGFALLQVDLTGRFHEYEHGFVAQHQEVVSIVFDRHCAWCGREHRQTDASRLRPAHRDEWSEPGSIGAFPLDLAALLPCCEEHAQGTHVTPERLGAAVHAAAEFDDLGTYEGLRRVERAREQQRLDAERRTARRRELASRPPEPVPTRCPNCGSDKIIPVAYGFPGHELMTASERGEVALGGCVIDPDNATHRCSACHADFGRLGSSRAGFDEDDDDL